MTLDRRVIAYWKDVTRVLTKALCGFDRTVKNASAAKLLAALGREGRYDAAWALDAALEQKRDPEPPPLDPDRS